MAIEFSQWRPILPLPSRSCNNKGLSNSNTAMRPTAAPLERASPLCVLLIEDEPQSALYMSEGLANAGWEVQIASDGAAGLAQARSGAFDVLVVDRMLPEMDGLSLVLALRDDGVQTPVLFLTAMGSVADRVAGLKAGGDDYLVKPFYLDELEARLQALARRSTTPLRERTLLRTRDLTLDRLTQSVARGGRTVELLPLEYKLLEFMMLNAGRPVTRAMLLERVWGFQFDPRTNIVETHISRLRGKLDESGAEPLITTLRGVGYVIRAD